MTMFLHSGASIHGHEFSRYASTPPVHPHNLRSPLLRSAFATPKRRIAAVSDEARPPALRRRPVSEYTPRTAEPMVRFKEPEPESEPEPSAMAPRQSLQVAASTQLAPQERPRPLAVSEDSFMSESEFSDVTQSTETSPTSGPARRKRRRALRKSTNYHLGYPTPKLLSKKKVLQKMLPRLMLQLQLVYDNGRSKPVLEVYPATHISGPVIAHRMAKRFPAIFKAKHQLCYDDLVLVKRDDYGVTSDGHDSGDEEKGLEDRKLLAVYSPLKNTDKAELVLDDGTTWVATPLRNGSCDFVNVDPHGNQTTVRWARRAASSSSPTEPATMNSGPFPVPESRYTFSIINPLTRRHPVMATLTRTSLSIQDTFTSVTSSHGRYPPSRPLGRTASMYEPTRYDRGLSAAASPGSMVSDDEENGSITQEPKTERTVHPVDDKTKLLISVTALWVALISGWSPNYTPTVPSSASRETAPDTSAPGTPVPSSARSSRRNTWTRNNTSTDSTAVVSTNKGYSAPLENSRSVSPAPRGASTPSPVPRRATSTGAAFMQRRIERKKIQGKDQGKETPPAEVDPEAGYFTAYRNNPRRTVSTTGYVWNPIARPQSEPVAEEPGNQPRASVGGHETGGTDGTEGKEQSASPPLTPAGEVVEDQKRGVRGRFSRWLHKLGGR